MLTLNCDKETTIEDLTLKLTKIWTLTSAARELEIHFLDTRFLLMHSPGQIFHFCKNTKTLEIWKSKNLVQCHLFTEKKNLFLQS